MTNMTVNGSVSRANTDHAPISKFNSPCVSGLRVMILVRSQLLDSLCLSVSNTKVDGTSPDGFILRSFI